MGQRITTEGGLTIDRDTELAVKRAALLAAVGEVFDHAQELGGPHQAIRSLKIDREDGVTMWGGHAADQYEIELETELT